MGVEKREMDVHLDQFLSARLGSPADKKIIPDSIYRIIVPGILPHGRLGG